MSCTGFQFLEVPPNEVIHQLEEDLDLSMTPSRGLRRWVNGQPVAMPKIPPKGRVLLLVHGTFSRGDMYFEEFAATEEGKTFLAKCEKKYAAVLTFRELGADPDGGARDDGDGHRQPGGDHRRLSR